MSDGPYAGRNPGSSRSGPPVNGYDVVRESQQVRRSIGRKENG